jgi:hypothetical protein
MSSFTQVTNESLESYIAILLELCTILQMSNVETGVVQKKREVRLDIEPAFLCHVLRSLPETYVCHYLFSQG